MSDAQTTTAEATPMRFSIRTLLVVVTVVCVLLAPYRWFGGWYLFSALCSCALVYLSYRGYTDPNRMSPVRLSVFAIFGGMCIGVGSLVFLLHGLFNLVGSIIGSRLRLAPRKFALTLSMLAIVAYSFFFASKYQRFQQLQSLRAQYPEASLEGRLEFERDDMAKVRGVDVLSRAVQVSLRLDAFETRDSPEEELWRVSALSKLHTKLYEHFIAAEGFGPARMPSFYAPSAESFAYERGTRTVPIALGDEVETEADGEELHDKITHDFFKKVSRRIVSAKLSAPSAPSALSLTGRQTSNKKLVQQ